MPIVYAWTRELELVLYGKSYITWIRASYTWQYVKRNILPRFYGISHARANSGAQAVFSLPRKKRPGNEVTRYRTGVSPAQSTCRLLRRLCKQEREDVSHFLAHCPTPGGYSYNLHRLLRLTCGICTLPTLPDSFWESRTQTFDVQ